MSKRLQIAICTRYRPLVATVLIIVVWTGSMLVFRAVGSAVGEIKEKA